MAWLGWFFTPNASATPFVCVLALEAAVADKTLNNSGSSLSLGAS
jgi:hypothetical protein